MKPTGTLLTVWTFVPPVIIFVGTIGNMFTFAAVTNRFSEKRSFMVYLSALAINDTLILYNFPLTSWLRYVFGIRLEEINTVFCKLLAFSSFLFPQISSWMVVALTAERTYCAFFPVNSKIVCRPKIGLAVVGIIVSVLAVLDSHLLYGMQLLEIENVTACSFADNRYMDFFFDAFVWIDFLVYFFIPIAIILIGNSATVVKVYKSSKVIMTTGSQIRRRRNLHILFITLLISCAFVVLVSPFSLFFALKNYVFNDVEAFYSSSNTEQIVETVVYILVFVNSAINFFLYILSGSRFRRNLMAVFKTERDSSSISTITRPECQRFEIQPSVLSNSPTERECQQQAMHLNSLRIA